MERADQLFLRPSPKYDWNDIVAGVMVSTQGGGSRRMMAVDRNTFRGFYRITKSCPGAMEGFIRYFLDHRNTLVESLSKIASRSELNDLANRICEGVRTNLTNSVPEQLRPYNKIRKPVDLYLEHLVGMARELDEHRVRLVPFLFLPLDSQILAHPALFSTAELAAHGLSRRSTYKDVASEEIYTELQDLLKEKAATVAIERGRSFHVIYFDMLWNNRHHNWGGNLFESNP